jgi:hypothetical protein
MEMLSGKGLCSAVIAARSRALFHRTLSDAMRAAQCRWSAADGLHAEFPQPRDDTGIAQTRVERALQLLDHHGGRSRGGGDARPGGDLSIRQPHSAFVGTPGSACTR